MDICRWCLKPIEETEIPGWHMECINKLAEFIEIVEIENA